MTKMIQQTENDIVITVDGKIYTADIATFELEAGGNFPRLPSDIEYRIYEPDIKHALVGNHGEISRSGDMPWTVGDNVINNIDTFIEAQTNAQVQAALQESALYDDSIREIQLKAQEIADKNAKDLANSLASYYRTKDGLKDYSANERYKKQISGTTSGIFGKILTDEKTQTMLTGLVASVQANIIDLPVNYKGVDEWAALSGDQIKALAKEVAGFVQKCFNTELELAADIEDGKITTTDEIDGAYKAF